MVVPIIIILAASQVVELSQYNLALEEEALGLQQQLGETENKLVDQHQVCTIRVVMFGCVCLRMSGLCLCARCYVLCSAVRSFL